jgi:hypothetical protein
MVVPMYVCVNLRLLAFAGFAGGGGVACDRRFLTARPAARLSGHDCRDRPPPTFVLTVLVYSVVVALLYREQARPRAPGRTSLLPLALLPLAYALALAPCCSPPAPRSPPTSRLARILRSAVAEA